MVRFTAADVVRHPLVGRIVEAYEGPGTRRHDARNRPRQPTGNGTVAAAWDALVRARRRSGDRRKRLPAAGQHPLATVELSVRLTGDEEVRALNAEWRGKDQPTNVLSFPMAEAEELDAAETPGPELMLGDIVLARGVCAAEAEDKGDRARATMPRI